MGWDEAEKKADEAAARAAAAGGEYLRLEAGEKIVIAIVGEPTTRTVVWDGARYDDYQPDEPSHKGLKPVLKFRIDVVAPDLEGQPHLTWEMSRVVFDQLRKVRAKYGLDKWIFELAREGTGTDTRYTILPEAKISDRKGLAALLKSTKFNDDDVPF